MHHALNFFAFLSALMVALSPDNTLSAPVFFPFAGQPYLGPNTLFHTLQELMLQTRQARKKTVMKERGFMLGTSVFFSLQRYKFINIIQRMQVNGGAFDEKARLFA